jgi:hypothetical protein
MVVKQTNKYSDLDNGGFPAGICSRKARSVTTGGGPARINLGQWIEKLWNERRNPSRHTTTFSGKL